jgi:hypothetical protein
LRIPGGIRALLSCAVLSSSCVTSSAVRAPGAVVTVDERQCGGALRAAGGTTVLVALKPLAGAGYSWSVEAVDGPATLVSVTTAPARVSSVPTDRDQLFAFRLGRRGAAMLKFEHKRPWEQQVTPIAVCEVGIEIVSR